MIFGKRVTSGIGNSVRLRLLKLLVVKGLKFKVNVESVRVFLLFLCICVGVFYFVVHNLLLLHLSCYCNFLNLLGDGEV